MDPVNNRISRTYVDGMVLCLVNGMNYSDRVLLAVILSDLKKEFNIKNDMAGLLQTTFFAAYVFTTPIIGYLGDRYNRKMIMAFSVLIWNIANLASSFMREYWTFSALRATFGVGQAGFTTIAPTVLSDLFVKDLRSRILAIFYLAIPVGMGLGYIIGKQMECAFGSWRWSLRATPCIGLINIMLILFVLREPIRGEVERSSFSYSTFTKDIKYLLTNASFVLCTLGFTCLAFTADAVSWWGPLMFNLGFELLSKDIELGYVYTVFGIVVIISGITGLSLGYLLSNKLKLKYPRSDPIICGIGLIVSTPFLVASSYATTYNFNISVVCLFMGLVMVNLNWALTVDILLYVVMSNRRSLAMGVQLFIGHGLGGLGSPYITGVFADYLFSKGVATDPGWNEFRSIQYASFLSAIVAVLGGIMFLLNSVYILDDIKKLQMLSEVESISEGL